ncbi:MAG: acyl-CoA desaturase [Gammaproteobacteria bacterium]|nr:acyl-CoA desaturase [Gammaproteobacteria bacterium]
MKNKLNDQQLLNLEADLNRIRDEALSKVGKTDADYIRRIIFIQRTAEVLGRVLLVMILLHPIFFIFGVLSLTLSKILDNMEIGHNVLHGQYDWMNDPTINSRTYEWDLAGDAKSWKRIHNHEHHTYTNIIGKDRDFGYGLLRLSDDLPWKRKNLWQFLTYLNLSFLFEWGIAYHELAAERVFVGKKKKNRVSPLSDDQLKKMFFSKAARQVFKDYIFFPLVCWPVFLPVLLANITANLLRNLWTSTIIFCGHFTEGVHTFSEKECENETKGHWYYRQILGSSNLTGRRWFHILTGHLSCQIEHHLFPDIPAHRYVEMSPKVQKVLEKYNIPYNTGSFFRQYATVVKRLIRYSLPPKEGARVTR